MDIQVFVQIWAQNYSKEGGKVVFRERPRP